MPRRQPRLLGDALREARQADGATQQAVAVDLGVAVRTYQRWEDSEVRPGAGQVFALADRLGVDARELATLPLTRERAA